MNPLLLLLLAGGGAVVAKKVYDNAVDCSPQTPPENPLFTRDFSLDYAKIASAMKAAADDRRNKRDAKVMTYAKGAAAVAAMVPVYGTIAAGIIIAAGYAYGLADSIVSKLGDDPNSEGYANNLAWWSRKWGEQGWIPAQPGSADSLKAIQENLRDGFTRCNDRAPYLTTLAHVPGRLLLKWGGHPTVLPLAGYFTSDPVGVTQGSMVPSGDYSLEHNAPRLKLAAQCIALEYGVQCEVDKIYAAAMQSAGLYQRTLAFLDYLRDTDGGEGHNAFVLLNFICGVHGAMTAAALIAKRSPPPPIDELTAMSPTGTPPKIDASLANSLRKISSLALSAKPQCKNPRFDPRFPEMPTNQRMIDCDRLL